MNQSDVCVLHVCLFRASQSSTRRISASEPASRDALARVGRLFTAGPLVCALCCKLALSANNPHHSGDKTTPTTTTTDEQQATGPRLHQDLLRGVR